MNNAVALSVFHEQFPPFPVIRFIAAVCRFDYWTSFIWCSESQKEQLTKLIYNKYDVHPSRCAVVTRMVLTSSDDVYSKVIKTLK